MDKEARRLAPAACAEREGAKSGAAYQGRASTWDLVDAMKNKDFILEDVNKEELPGELQSMSPDELRSHVEKNTRERQEILK
jgi:hypothetical protein